MHDTQSRMDTVDSVSSLEPIERAIQQYTNCVSPENESLYDEKTFEILS